MDVSLCQYPQGVGGHNLHLLTIPFLTINTNCNSQFCAVRLMCIFIPLGVIALILIDPLDRRGRTISSNTNNKISSPPMFVEVNEQTPLDRYTVTLSKYHPKFLPELIPEIISWLYMRREQWLTIEWKNEDKVIMQCTLAACCLVSREWNRLFTPSLYEDIFLGGAKSLLTCSLLDRTFQHTQSTHKNLVKTMTIWAPKDGSIASLLSICFSMPNLRKLILDFEKILPDALHPNLVQQLQSLSRSCTVQMAGGYWDGMNTDWESLSSCISFIRRSHSTPCRLDVRSSGGACYILFTFRNNLINHQDISFYSNTYFYVGKQKASVSGHLNPSGTQQFKRHLTQTGQNLKGLHLSPSTSHFLPGKCGYSLQFRSFLYNFLRNRPQQESQPSIVTVQLRSR